MVKGKLNKREEDVLIDFISKYYYYGWGSFVKVFDYNVGEIDASVVKNYIEEKIINGFGYANNIISILNDEDYTDYSKIGEIHWIYKDMELLQDLFDLFCVLRDKLKIVSDYLDVKYDGWKVVDVKRKLVYYGDKE